LETHFQGRRSMPLGTGGLFQRNYPSSGAFSGGFYADSSRKKRRYLKIVYVVV
jgi:hypothetical protein